MPIHTSRRRALLQTVALAGAALAASGAAPALADDVVTYADGEERTAPLVLTDDTGLDVPAGEAEQSGDISESGGSWGVEKTGDGVLILSGDNSYSGGTTFSGGVAQVSATENLGSQYEGLTFNGGTLRVTDGFPAFRNIIVTEAGGTVDVAEGANFLTAYSLSGSGDLRKTGDGSYQILTSGGQTYSGTLIADEGILNLNFVNLPDANLIVNAGGVVTTGALEIARLSGDGSLVVLGNDVSVNFTGESEFSGVISGDGGVSKFGDGVLILSGDNTYRGNTSVSAGVLRIGSDSNLGDEDAGVSLRGGVVELTDSITSTRQWWFYDGAVDTAEGTTSTLTNVGGYLAKQGKGRLVAESSNLTGASVYDGVLEFATLDAFGPHLGFFGGTIALTGDGFSDGNNYIGEAGGTLDIAEGATLEVAGTFRGEGNLTKAGGGTLLLGPTGYQGDTTIDDGVLIVSGGNVLSDTSAVTIGADGTFHLDSDETIGSLFGDGAVTLGKPGVVIVPTFLSVGAGDYAGSVSGEGGLIKVGDGVLVLSGVNTGWAITIEDGVVTAASDDALGSGRSVFGNGVVSIRSDATLDYADGVTIENGLYLGQPGAILNQSGGVATQAGNIESFGSTGSFVKTGDGLLILAGGSDLTGETRLLEGALGLDHPFALGNTVLTAADGTAVWYADGADVDNAINLEGAVQLTVDAGAVAEQAGVVTGAGGVTKTGMGTLILSGDSDFAMPFVIAAGAGVVNGSIAADVQTAQGAVLGGSGQVGALTADGTVAPGNSIGVLTVAGDATLGASSTYQAEIAADGTSDLLAVGGVATLEGGRLQLVMLDSPGAYLADQTYTLLTAAGGVDGAFGDIVSPSILLAMDLSYGPTAVTVDVSLSEFPNLAATGNQAAAGAGLQQFAPSGDGLTVLDSLFPLDQAGVQGAFDSASGEAHASFRLATAQASELFQTALMARVAPLSAETGAGTAVWASGMGEDGSVDADGNAADLDHSLTGLALGAEVGGPAGGGALRAGAAVGMLDGEASVDARASEADIGAWQIGAYGAWQAGGLRLSGAASYGQAEIESTRDIAWAGLARTATADRDADMIAGVLEASWSLTGGANGFDIAPLALIDYVGGEADAVTESGADSLDLELEAMDYDRLEAGLGLAVGLRGETFAFDARAAYRERLDGEMPEQTLAFSGAPGAGFTVAGPDTGSSRVTAGVGVSAAIAQNLTISARYDGSFASDAEAHQGSIDLGWRF